MAASPRKNPLKQERTDFEVFLALLFTSKGLILFCLAVTVGLTALLSLSTPKQYEATAKILAEPQKEDNPYVLEARSQQERHMFLETQKELVVSQSVLTAALADAQGRPQPAVSLQDIEKFQRTISVRSRSGMGKNPFSGDGIGESNTFFITARSNGPYEAAKVVNAIVDNYLKAVARIRAEQAQGAAEILESAVTDMKQRTQEAHRKLADFEAETGSLLPELMNIDKPTVRVYPELQELRASYESERTEIARTRAIVQALEASLKTEPGQEPVIPPEVITNNPSVKVLKQKLAELRIKLGELSPYFTDNSREVTSLKEQIGAVEKALHEEIGRVLEGERQTLTAIEKGLEQREATLTDYDEKLRELSLMNSQHAEFKREYLGTAKALDSQLESLAVARIASAERSARAANIAVIDRGVPNLKPVTPRFFRNIVLAALLGLGIGVLLVVIRQVSYPIFVHPRQVERLTDLPVVATLSTISPGEKAHDLRTTKI